MDSRNFTEAANCWIFMAFISFPLVHMDIINVSREATSPSSPWPRRTLSLIEWLSDVLQWKCHQRIYGRDYDIGLGSWYCLSIGQWSGFPGSARWKQTVPNKEIAYINQSSICYINWCIPGTGDYVCLLQRPNHIWNGGYNHIHKWP